MATPEEKLEEVNRMLDEYEESLGLPKPDNKNGDLVKKYLSMHKSELERIHPAECDEMVVVLNSYAMYLNRKSNRERANMKWAEKCLKYSLAGKTQQYTGSWENQEYSAIKENAYCQGLIKIITAAQQRIDTLYFLSANVKDISDSLKNLAYGKRQRNE